MKLKSVLIADDNQVFADSLKIAFEALNRFDEIQVATNFEGIKKQLSSLPDLVVLDLHFLTNEYDGIQVAKYIKSNFGDEVKVLILSQHIRIDCYQQLLDEIGVDGYMDKGSSLKAVLRAINRIEKGEVVVDESITAMQERGVWLNASKREREVLDQLILGLPQKQIADKLFISPKTVEVHLSNLRKRLNVNSTAELVKLYVRYRKSIHENPDESEAPFEIGE